MVRFVKSIALAAVAVATSAQTPAQAPVFRTETEAVWVTTTAIDRDGRLVTNLGRDDFEVLVDGAVQPINQFRSDHIPFALSIMFDLSGSLIDGVPTMRRAMVELVDQFQPGDRANVGSFHTVPSVDARFSSNREVLLRTTAELLVGAVSRPCRGPWSSDSWRLRNPGASGIWDAVSCSIDTVAGDAETPRRVVMLITDGFDNVSVSDVGEVRALADTYGVMVYVLAMVGTQGLNTGALRSLASETGGGYFVLNHQEDMTPTFARIAEELRQQYVLGYSGPAGASQKGKLEVRVKRPGVTARGRRATMTVLPLADSVKDSISRAPVNPPVLSAPAPPPSAANEGVFDRFARNVLGPADLPRLSLADLRLAVVPMRAAGEQWIRAGGAGQEYTRRIQLATFVLAFLSRQDDLRHWAFNDAPSDLLQWASGLVRTGTPQPIERLWHLTAIALLERLGAPGHLQVHLGYAQGRFPDEPRFVLGRAMAAEMQVWPQHRDETGFDVQPDAVVKIISQYEEAMRYPEVRQEAHLRIGYFQLLRGRVDEALGHFDQAGTPDDKSLRYWLHLFRGKAFSSARRHDEAIASFGLAFKEVPYAQSATLALGAALVTRGQHNEAAALTSQMLALPVPPLDPWIYYTLPEWRFWESRMESLRKGGGS
jgi:VWFA-related protein